MVNLPNGLPYFMRTQLAKAQTQDELIESLCPQNLAEIDPRERKAKVDPFTQFFLAASQDDAWLKSNPGLAMNLFKRAISLYQCNTKYKERFRRLLATCLPKFKTIEGLKDDVTFRFRDFDVMASSKILSWQSDFFEKMLLGGSTYRENLAFSSKHPVDIARDRPELMACLFEGLDKFVLDVPPETTVEDLEKLIRAAKEYLIENSAFPLIEAVLLPRITIDNAYYLYFLGQDNGMRLVCDRCLSEIQKNVNDSDVFLILRAAQQEDFEDNKTVKSAIINCCLNYAIDRLPQYFDALGHSYDPETKQWDERSHSPSEEENHAIAFLNRLLEFLPLATCMDSPNLHKLQERELRWVLQNLPEDLEALNLSYFDFKTLINLDRFSNLRSLNLSNCKNLLWMDALKSLGNSLEHLDLTNCESLKNFGALTSLIKLKSFYFPGCKSVTETGLEALASFSNLENMTLRYSDSESIDRLLTRISEERGWDVKIKTKSKQK